MPTKWFYVWFRRGILSKHWVLWGCSKRDTIVLSKGKGAELKKYIPTLVLPVFLRPVSSEVQRRFYENSICEPKGLISPFWFRSSWFVQCKLPGNFIIVMASRLFKHGLFRWWLRNSYHSVPLFHGFPQLCFVRQMSSREPYRNRYTHFRDAYPGKPNIIYFIYAVGTFSLLIFIAFGGLVCILLYVVSFYLVDIT